MQRRLAARQLGRRHDDFRKIRRERLVIAGSKFSAPLVQDGDGAITAELDFAGPLALPCFAAVVACLGTTKQQSRPEQCPGRVESPGNRVALKNMRGVRKKRGRGGLTPHMERAQPVLSYRLHSQGYA